MSLPPIIQYPLDLEGTSPTNKVVGERREITTNNARVFVPKAGPFYTSSFTIINVDTGLPLKPVDDFVLAQPFSQASLRSGKDVQCAVVIKSSAPISVEISYQVVGGEYSWNLKALADLIEELDLDERPVKWGSILGRPTAYPPAPHIHDIGDSYGWEYVVWQLERITNAILVGDEASHDELRAQMEFIRGQLQDNIDALEDKVDAHLNDFTNPHKTTKAQVGLGLVQNYPVASTVEANAGTVNDRYMTPSLVSVLATRLATEITNAHEAKKNNPHAVTKAQVGLGSVDNFGTATQAQAETATANNLFMTPLRTYQSIMIHAGNLLRLHVDDKNNPHKVTKAQVGLGQVEDYPVASTAEANTGTAKNRYMTPSLVSILATRLATEITTAHEIKKNNPHAVTKAQTGLGSVDNFGTATQAQAETATANNLFMTPLRTYQSIMIHAGTLIRQHVDDKNNPHNTTKAQVGLGLVDNFQTASQAEAVAGTLDTRFMTPLRTKQAIDAIAGDMIRAHVSNLSNPHAVTKAQVGLSNLPNAISRSRTLSSDAHLLTAGGMYDHAQSGDHDARYVKINVQTNTSLRVVNNTLQGYISGSWRQLWPATWTNHVAPGAADPNLSNSTDIALLNAGGILYASVNQVWRQVWPPMWVD